MDIGHEITGQSENADARFECVRGGQRTGLSPSLSVHGSLNSADEHVNTPACPSIMSVPNHGSESEQQRTTRQFSGIMKATNEPEDQRRLQAGEGRGCISGASYSKLNRNHGRPRPHGDLAAALPPMPEEGTAETSSITPENKPPPSTWATHQRYKSGKEGSGSITNGCASSGRPETRTVASLDSEPMEVEAGRQRAAFPRNGSHGHVNDRRSSRTVAHDPWNDVLKRSADDGWVRRVSQHIGPCVQQRRRQSSLMGRGMSAIANLPGRTSSVIIAGIQIRNNEANAIEIRESNRSSVACGDRRFSVRSNDHVQGSRFFGGINRENSDEIHRSRMTGGNVRMREAQMLDTSEDGAHMAEKRTASPRLSSFVAARRSMVSSGRRSMAAISMVLSVVVADHPLEQFRQLSAQQQQEEQDPPDNGQWHEWDFGADTEEGFYELPRTLRDVFKVCTAQMVGGHSGVADLSFVPCRSRGHSDMGDEWEQILDRF